MLEHVYFSVARLLCTSSNKGDMNTRAFLKLRQHSSPSQEGGSGLVERVRSWRAGQIETPVAGITDWGRVLTPGRMTERSAGQIDTYPRDQKYA